MSLVLEALKKQEAGQDPEAAVSLARASNARRRHRLWAGLFAVAMAVNAALLVWVFVLPATTGSRIPDPTVTPPAHEGTEDTGTASTEGAERPGGTRSAESAGDSIAQPRLRAPQNPTPESAPTAAPAEAPAQTITPPPTAAARPAPAAAVRRVRLGELPADVRRRFPGIAFSTHIYADDADLRAVMANGQRLTEGDRIRGLELLEITEDGVVLGFERYEVVVPIVTDWNAL